MTEQNILAQLREEVFTIAASRFEAQYLLEKSEGDGNKPSILSYLSEDQRDLLLNAIGLVQDAIDEAVDLFDHIHIQEE